MGMVRGRWFGRAQRRSARNSIDLGGGHRVAPEDLLEGHFRRLATDWAASLTPQPALAPAGPRTQEVRVQVAPRLDTAIRVVAPTLAPLAQIAEELAAKIPTVQPPAQFRAELHEALEQAHRRHLEQQSLSPLPAPRRTLPWLLAGLLAALGLAGVALWLLRRRD
jgi:hypothetical protein